MFRVEGQSQTEATVERSEIICYIGVGVELCWDFYQKANWAFMVKKKKIDVIRKEERKLYYLEELLKQWRS